MTFLKEKNGVKSKNASPKMVANAKVYVQRRATLARQIKNGIAIVPTAHEKIRNADTHYGYRFDSHFYYLTGFQEPEAVVVIIAGRQPKSILFCRRKSLEREIWDGYRY